MRRAPSPPLWCGTPSGIDPRAPRSSPKCGNVSNRASRVSVLCVRECGPVHTQERASVCVCASVYVDMCVDVWGCVYVASYLLRGVELFDRLQELAIRLLNFGLRKERHKMRLVCVCVCYKAFKVCVSCVVFVCACVVCTCTCVSVCLESLRSSHRKA